MTILSKLKTMQLAMTTTQVKVIVKNKTNERKEKKGEQTSILFIKTSLLDDHTNKKKIQEY